MSVPTTPDEPRPAHDDHAAGTAPDPVRDTAPEAPPAPDEAVDDSTELGADRGSLPPFPPAPGNVSAAGAAGVPAPAGAVAEPLDDEDRRR